MISKKFFVLTVVSVLGASLLSACGKGGDSGGETAKGKRTMLNVMSRGQATQQLAKYSTILFDSNLSDYELGALGYDFKKMEKMDLTGTTLAGSRTNEVLEDAFARLFGNARGETLVPFLTTRVQRFSSGTPGNDATPGAGAHRIAYNSSLGEWLTRAARAYYTGADPSQIPAERIGGKLLDVNSTRIGFVTLDYYSVIDNSIFRIGTIVHEARHSDCPNGMTKFQLESVLEKARRGESFREVLGNCSFGHDVCPAGHQYAGLDACETGEGWGSYAVTIPLMKKVAETCANCDEADLQAAQMSYLDDLSRISQKDKLLSGELGTPNMEHKGFVN